MYEKWKISVNIASTVMLADLWNQLFIFLDDVFSCFIPLFKLIDDTTHVFT